MNQSENKIIHGDCLEHMMDIPNKSIDMILCDLPYGTTACKWDSIIPFNRMWISYERIIKDNGAIILTSSQPFTSSLVMSNPKIFRYEFIWIKNKGGNPLTANKMPMKEHESILVFYKKFPTYNEQLEKRAASGLKRVKSSALTGGSIIASDVYGSSIQNKRKYSDLRKPKSVQFFNVERGLHPTQKPVALFEYLIKTYTNEGDMVLDNCAGSGTTGIACINTNRKFILIEKEEKYIEKMKNRIYNHAII